MRRISRCTGGLMIALAVLACDSDSIFNGDRLDDVEAIAEVQHAENLVVLAVENRGSGTVYYHTAWLERKEGGDWERFQPPGWAETGDLPLIPIEPGDAYVHEHEIHPDSEALTLTPGEWRFRVSMSADGTGNVPSEDAVASNAFQIEP